MQAKLESYCKEVNQFIDQMRQEFDKTFDEAERRNRHGALDTLLNLATYGSATELEAEFRVILPEIANKALDDMRAKIREINGVCTFTLSDSHELYRDMQHSERQEFRNQLGKAITDLIFEKTEDCQKDNFSLSTSYS